MIVVAGSNGTHCDGTGCLTAWHGSLWDCVIVANMQDFQAVKMKANMVTGVVNLFVLNRLLAAFEGVAGKKPILQCTALMP